MTVFPQSENGNQTAFARNQVRYPFALCSIYLFERKLIELVHVVPAAAYRCCCGKLAGTRQHVNGRELTHSSMKVSALVDINSLLVDFSPITIPPRNGAGSVAQAANHGTGFATDHGQ